MLSRLWLAISFLRLPNLVLVFLSLAIPYWCVLHPAIARTGGIAVLDERGFGILALATVLTTLAGYVINDFFDHKIDAINRPDELVVGKYLPPIVVLVLYALVLGGVTYLSYQFLALFPGQMGQNVFWLFPAVSVLLFLYAWQLKCMPFIGNLLVAFLCGITPLILLIPEDRPLWLASFSHPRDIREAVGLVWLYGLFAFVTNLFREQIKDLEDAQGDSACGCNTTPVQRGIRFAKKTTGLTGLLLCALVVFLMVFWQDRLQQEARISAGVLLLLFPTVVSTFLVFSAKDKRDFSRASLALKVTMLAGIFLLLPHWPASKLEWLQQWEGLKEWWGLMVG
jgi:4-hydroxybenzoate polyprenyltransferase